MSTIDRAYRSAPTDTATPAAGSLDERARIMLVDDEPALVRSLRRHLASHFRVVTFTDPAEALARIDEHDDLAVVISDMRMPGMDGATLLAAIAERRPDVTRILLTGFTEVDAAIMAINHGRIFRFLSKPIAPEDLIACLQDGVAQYRLRRAEQDVLEQTVRGSVQALVDTLAMADPVAFARATRMRTRLSELVDAVGAPNRWEIDVAGLLSHLGAVMLPRRLNERLARGDELTASDQEQVDRMPETAVGLLAGIPRLDHVCRIIAMTPQRFDGRGPVKPDVGGTDIPLGARLLRVVGDYDQLEARRQPAQQSIEQLRARDGIYDPEVLATLAALVDGDGDREVVHLAVKELTSGMELATELTTHDGTLLAAEGQQLSARMVDRLIAWSRHTSIREPVAVYPQRDHGGPRAVRRP